MDPIKVAVVGQGWMGDIYARAVRESPAAQLVAVVGNSPDKTVAAGARWGVPAYSGGDLAGLLNDLPGVEAIIIASPEWTHREPAVLALNKGLHVLLEKPMADTWDQAQRIAEAAAGARSVFMLCHSVRFDPRFAAMQAMAAAGEIGTIRFMNGRRNADQQAYRRIAGRMHPAYWLTPHDVDLMRWVTGSEVVEVAARWIGDGAGESDGLLVDLRFASGALGRIENAWVTPPLMTAPRNGLFDVLGDGGSIEVSEFDQGVVAHLPDSRVKVPDTTQAAVVAGRVTGALPNLVAHFLDVVRGRAQPLVTLGDGLATMRVARAIETALRQGAQVVP